MSHPLAATALMKKAIEMAPEVKVISRFTLVPVTLVLAAVVGTFSVSNWFWVDKTRIALIEQKADNTQAALNEYKADVSRKMEKMTETLTRIDKNVAVIAAKNDDDG